MDPGHRGGPLTVIAFSKDRPLQLHAALTSLRATCLDPERLRTRVVVYASTDEMAARYLQVARELPWIELVPEDDFRANVLACAAGTEHLAFLVDDTVFVQGWRAGQVLELLEAIPKALGVSLRLGRNTTHCYTMDQPQAVPPMLELSSGWLVCDWTEAAHDFGYPLELSSSVYRARDVRPLLEAGAYRNPNELEARLAEARPTFAASHPALVLPAQSIAFSVPLNMVQQAFQNRHGGRADRSPEALGKAFDAGARVDVAALRGHVPRACHEEVELPLVGQRGQGAAPAVSVVVPCWSQAQYLPFAVSSVALQRFTDWELIVVDDGSPDETARVVRDLAAQLPGRRLRLLRQPNAGLANARNAGIAAARGRYVLPLDADDAIDAAFLERTVAALEADPSLAIAYSDAGIFGAREGVWTTRRPFDAAHLREENGVPCCALFRREVWERSGGYRASMSAGYEDWDFWLGAAEQGFRAVQIPEPLFLYREKAGSMLSTARRFDRSLRAQLCLNHPALFGPEAVAEARRTPAADPLPPAKPAASPVEVDLRTPAGPPGRPAQAAEAAQPAAAVPAAPAPPAAQDKAAAPTPRQVFTRARALEAVRPFPIHPEWEAMRGELRDFVARGELDTFLKHPICRRNFVREGFGPAQRYELETLQGEPLGRQLLGRAADPAVGGPAADTPVPGVSANTLGMVYYLWRLRRSFPSGLPSKVVEVGGGYGSLARLYLQEAPQAAYVIIDLPEMLALQLHFLERSLPAGQRVRYAESGPLAPRPGEILLVPASLTAEVERTELFVSTFAFSEMPREAQRIVDKHDYFGARHVFLAGQLATELPNLQWVKHAEVAGPLMQRFQRLAVERFHIGDNYLLEARR